MQADAIAVLLHSSILVLNRVYSQAYLRNGGNSLRSCICNVVCLVFGIHAPISLNTSINTVRSASINMFRI